MAEEGRDVAEEVEEEVADTGGGGGEVGMMGRVVAELGLVRLTSPF